MGVRMGWKDTDRGAGRGTRDVPGTAGERIENVSGWAKHAIDRPIAKVRDFGWWREKRLQEEILL